MIEKYLFQHEQAEIQWDSFHTVGLKTIAPEPHWAIYVKYII